MGEHDQTMTHEEQFKPCPFCGGEVDPRGWLQNGGVRGPECNGCGATAPNLSVWETRHFVAFKATPGETVHIDLREVAPDTIPGIEVEIVGEVVVDSQIEEDMYKEYFRGEGYP